MEELVAQKVENQWNTMLMSTGVYTIEMKEIESRIDAVKKALILQDIARVKIRLGSFTKVLTDSNVNHTRHFKFDTTLHRTFYFFNILIVTYIKTQFIVYL